MTGKAFGSSLKPREQAGKDLDDEQGRGTVFSSHRFLFAFIPCLWQHSRMWTFWCRRILFLLASALIAGCEDRSDRIAAAETKKLQAQRELDQGRFQVATELAREAVTSFTNLFGQKNVRTIDTRVLLSQSLVGSGEVDKAVSEGRAAVEDATAIGDRDLETLLHARTALASVLVKKQDSDGSASVSAAQEAEEICQAALPQADNELGAESSVAITARQVLAVAQNNLGKRKEAIRTNTALLEMQRLKFGNEDDGTLSTRMNLASMLLEEKLFDPAQREFQSVYDIRRKKLGEDHPDTLVAKAWIGTCLADQKLYSAAIPVMVDVWERRKRVLGESHRRTLAAGFNLAVAKMESGSRAEAIQIVVGLHQVAQKNLGPEDSQTQMYRRALDKVR